MVVKEYTLREEIVFYGKRFLKVFVPAALILIPSMGFGPETFVMVTLIPLLTTFEKWMRNQGWYDL